MTTNSVLSRTVKHVAAKSACVVEDCASLRSCIQMFAFMDVFVLRVRQHGTHSIDGEAQTLLEMVKCRLVRNQP